MGRFNSSLKIKAPKNYPRALLITIRAALLIFFIFCFDGLLDFGTSPYLLSLFGAVGILSAAKLAETSLLSRGFFTGLALLATGYWSLAKAANYIFGSSGYLETYLVTQHIQLGVIVFILGSASTWFFFRWVHFLTLELFIIAASCIYLMAPHRNYHLDSPQFINTLAWQFGVEPQTMLLVCGAVLILALMLLLAFAEARESRLVFHHDREQRHSNWALSLVTVLSLVFIIFGVGKVLYNNYDTAKGLTTNGVGEASEEGTSPLGFHSALGSTNQPAALVRLEGDYSQNPFSPMLYLREGALSLFNGNELVIASKKFDTDVNNTSPNQLFTGTEDPALKDRTEVVQSIYLMADQKMAFAIDYPLSIKQLKNPDPQRFKSAYRAYSLAPAFRLESVTYEKVGDPRWSKELLDHYLVTHPDHRYRDLALRLTENVASPVEKANVLINFLSKRSIYTLTPKHDTKPGEDQVAPYLFGDMRGYCVHFAHATVYMLRALGIPSRIATGYLTDLSQSKDGHILLRMSDRHAWAEVYVSGYGWLPFDTQPEQVESAAETTVDMNLLEELMGKLDPGEEILPKDTLQDEPNITPVSDIYAPTVNDIANIIGIIVFIVIVVKLYIRFSWLLPGSSRAKLNRTFRALLASLSEVGFERLPGETLSEFRDRLVRELNKDVLRLSDLVTEHKYRRPDRTRLEPQGIVRSYKACASALDAIPLWRRVIGFVNPLSIFGSAS